MENGHYFVRLKSVLPEEQSRVHLLERWSGFLGNVWGDNGEYYDKDIHEVIAGPFTEEQLLWSAWEAALSPTSPEGVGTDKFDTAWYRDFVPEEGK